ncbi:nucleoside phosphorylase [Geoalkalibacter halelectricus]|uniref:Uridine phosphorylase n=1 Tax=Geoalkalibacter halelectricus TaxID=2847045 RepID=A0ABY5ZM48_9BACT|nr:nucleoside phosphorylase [Geoalkalibacter halelectricus]MDO3378983.1 nucleoside phosphorylase [Geoalkalibacter halelectricus]UWZ78799.1 nucleoside phosphorylase [Geoalkalibacter halelectricus]
MTDAAIKYHIGFGLADLGPHPPTLALLSGDPERAYRIATADPEIHLEKKLSHRRGLASYLLQLPNGRRILSATSGMGAPSLSIVVNELFAVGIRQIIRVGTCGSLQDEVRVGSLVISRAALCRQGAADDIAPPEYPAAADPFLTLRLVEAARELGIPWHLGVTASVDTFYEGQERILSSSNPHLLRRLHGINEEYRRLGILNYEMEAGTLFKMAGVYGFAAACLCAVVANRGAGEEVALDLKAQAEADAIRLALHVARLPEEMLAG